MNVEVCQTKELHSLALFAHCIACLCVQFLIDCTDVAEITAVGKNLLWRVPY